MDKGVQELPDHVRVLFHHEERGPGLNDVANLFRVRAALLGVPLWIICGGVRLVPQQLVDRVR